jgi:hypothetical protein
MKQRKEIFEKTSIGWTEVGKDFQPVLEKK